MLDLHLAPYRTDEEVGVLGALPAAFTAALLVAGADKGYGTAGRSGAGLQMIDPERVGQ
jgi:hypothetical protein